TSPSKTAVELGKPAKYFGVFLIADLKLLTASKLPTQAIENRFRNPLSGGRRVNFDPRYIPSPESRSRFDQQCQSAHQFRIPLSPKRVGDRLFNH
ncbi:MAG: hypothetical protein ACXW6R_10255, partial [Candidatus Binatia bacterium]